MTTTLNVDAPALPYNAAGEPAFIRRAGRAGAWPRAHHDVRQSGLERREEERLVEAAAKDAEAKHVEHSTPFRPSQFHPQIHQAADDEVSFSGNGGRSRVAIPVR